MKNFLFGYQEHLLILISPHSFKPRKNIPVFSRHHPKETRVSRNAQNVCAVTKVDTVLKTSYTS